MPTLIISTNARVENEEALMQDATEIIHTELGKPKKYILVEVRDNCKMIMNGSTAPAVNARLLSLGTMEPEANKRVANRLCALFEKHTGAAGDRTYIEFTDPGRANLGYNYATFA
ncbi:putative ATLS1-like light-inducible protein [Syncephalis pseudoplumigaleata]|uniref:L-dopachrome isomerase n=1 Tax=Syncephalis pseudoplumigaleata TaxID=1712513 RepID=A0A4P9Z2R9_9FUNG|nr:putative ATLS1-like light-inducible protein [Syncephalis pseudoplumigaleata]|eukprot:RKP26706.1 putative ATLS1-like light-inducible protein [Syncephalis pseudoplumigaleata]